MTKEQIALELALKVVSNIEIHSVGIASVGKMVAQIYNDILANITDPKEAPSAPKITSGSTNCGV